MEAKLPKGDWLWPAIWLLPEVSTNSSNSIDIIDKYNPTCKHLIPRYASWSVVDGLGLVGMRILGISLPFEDYSIGAEWGLVCHVLRVDH